MTRRFAFLLARSPAWLLVLALLVGTGAGFGAIIFRELIAWFSVLFTGQADYARAATVTYPAVAALGPWFIVLVPVVGGLLYGPLVAFLAPEARGHGVPEVMLAVARDGGRIRPQVAAVKAVASAVCIGAGGSVGREGPIVQIGSALGSTLGQLTRASQRQVRLLVACGAAGGISATFNAPIAGVLFALEIILRDFGAESVGVVVLSSVAANVVGRAAFGNQPFLSLPPFEITSLWEYVLYVGLGIVCAAVALLFVRVLYSTEDLCDRIWRGPEWLRPAAGGLLLGLLLFALPEMYGVGYPPLEQAIRGGYGLGFLLVLLVGKVAATSLTIGIGGSGGVFAPSLFLGAMAGTAYGKAFGLVLPIITGPAGAYGLVGMAAVFAAAAQAPMSAAVILFELTGDYRIVLPLLLAISVATSVAGAVSSNTIYSLKLKRRGVDLEAVPERSPMMSITVRQAMDPVPSVIGPTAKVEHALETLRRDKIDALPVVDGKGSFRGMVTVERLEQAVRNGAAGSPVGELAQATDVVGSESTLEDALPSLVQHQEHGLPVLGPDGLSLVGWLRPRDILRAYVRGAKPRAHLR